MSDTTKEFIQALVESSMDGLKRALELDAQEKVAEIVNAELAAAFSTSPSWYARNDKGWGAAYVAAETKKTIEKVTQEYLEDENNKERIRQAAYKGAREAVEARAKRMVQGKLKETEVENDMQQIIEILNALKNAQ